ncbi:MAG: NAD-dependent epimerase/dehydratase family protein [Phycisphaerales bacterium]
MSTPHPHPLNRARRVLITGGAGFIGSHLADLLLTRGDSVTVVDNLSTGRRSNLPGAHPNLRFIEADLGPALNAFGPGERFDEVYHLAAAVGVRLITQDPIRSIETHIEQTAALLRFVHARGTPPCLLASSSEVYGKSAHSPFSEEDDVVYGPTTVPRWSYAASKAVDEYLGLAYHRQHSLPIVIARFFNTVGPRQVGDYGMVLPRFVSAALANLPIEVHGDGEQTRCFCDVRDVAAILPTLLKTPACHGRVFNVGSESPISILGLAREVIGALGSASQVRLIPYTQAFGANFEDLRQRRPDLRRVREAVGFEPKIPLHQTIRDLAANIRGDSAGGAS